MLSRAWKLSRQNFYISARLCASTRTPHDYDRLRILFCGADEFSIYSLRALDALKQEQPHRIASLDVVCRPDKRVGRGLKQIQQVPIKAVANDLGLRLHEIDTFAKWSPGHPVDLVVTASFGLLVPARILEASTYGGLNVHPSLLPDLSGAAPLQHTLLKRRSHCGVTLQVMHPTKFDQGAILAQTPAPGVPVPQNCTPDELLTTLGPTGADMLCKAVEDGLFVPPIHDIRPEMTNSATYAPKITPEDRHIDWNTWTAADIVLWDRIVGPLWDAVTFQRCMAPGGVGSGKRITFHGPWETRNRTAPEGTNTSAPGTPHLYYDSNVARIGLTSAEGHTVWPRACTIEGAAKEVGFISLANALRRHQRAVMHKQGTS